MIKIERPEVGDQARGWGPPFLEGESAYFLSVNRNKRSVELDIKRPRRLRAACTPRSRAPTCFSPTILGWTRSRAQGSIPTTLAREQPRLVYGAISGYGHTGPKANRGGYDIIAQGEAGLMALTGPGRRRPEPLPDADGRHLGRHLHLHRRTRGALCARRARGRQGKGPAHRRRARRRADELAREHRRELFRDGQTAVAARQRAPELSRRISRYGRATRP